MHNSSEHSRIFWQQLRRKKLFLACSGGVDSMVLLHILRSLNTRLTVLHVNYQLRGEASNGDAAFVQTTCEEHNIPFEIRTVNLKEKLENGGNLQEEARKVRYDWFHEIVNDHPDHRVLLAHHADDQLETFWMNLSRKSGVLGMACMKKEHQGIVRPLLDFSRAEILSYAHNHGVHWREDQSNASRTYTRNRLRHEFIPFLDGAIPSLKVSVPFLVQLFQRKQLELEQKVASLTQTILTTNILSISTFEGLDQWERVELFRQLNLPSSYVDRMNELNERGKHIVLRHPRFEKIVRDQDQFTFLRKENQLFTLVLEEVDALPAEFNKDVVYFDASKIQGQLQVRKWEIGDRIAPIGMRGSQLISAIIKDAKITADAKQQQLVVHDDNTILWCVGLKISRKALPDDSSRQLLRCSINASTKEE